MQVILVGVACGPNIHTHTQTHTRTQYHACVLSMVLPLSYIKYAFRTSRAFAHLIQVLARFIFDGAQVRKLMHVFDHWRDSQSR